jgi:hypothetical protein
MNVSEQPIIRTDVLTFYKDPVKSRRVITIGKYLKAVVIETFGTTPQSNIKLSGGMTLTLREFVRACNGNLIEVQFGNNTDSCRLIWNIIIKCFDFDEKQFTRQTSQFKIRILMLSNDRSISDNIYSFVKSKGGNNALTINDVPKDKLEYYIPFYRFDMFENLRTLVLDDIVYSRNLQFQNDFQKVYNIEQRDIDSNLFYSRFFKFYERVLKQIESQDNVNVNSSQAAIDLKRSVEILKLKKERLSSQITIKEGELVNNYYANKQTINKTILQYNHDIIKLNDDLTILTAGIEGFQQKQQVQLATIGINYPISLVVVDSYKDQYRKVKFNIPLNITLKTGDNVKLTNQQDTTLNGNYIVEKTDPYVVVENIPSVSFFATFKILKINKDDVDKLFYNDLKKTIIATSDKLMYFDTVWFHDLNEKAHLIQTKNNTTIAIIHKGLQETLRKNEHMCVEDKNILDPNVCESKGYVWDRMCKTNFDCPFFNEKNSRGGCNSNGYCEMPIGAKQIGFTKFSNVKGIYCHGCTDETSPHCCTVVSDENNGRPAFAGDARPLVETFENDDKLVIHLRNMSTNFDMNMDLWRPISPELYLVELAAKTILGKKFELYRAYPVEQKFYKSYDKISKEILFSSLAIIKDGTVISYDTLYQPDINNMMFTKSIILGKVGIGILEFQSYTDVIHSLPSSSLF